MKKNLFFKIFIIPFFSLCFSIIFNIMPLKAASTPKYISLGDDNAPITIYEFSAFSCSHCADFHLNNLPNLTADYINKKLLRIVFIDVPMGGEVILFAHSLIYEFKNNQAAVNFSHLLFANQIPWLTGDNPNEQLIKYAKLSGLNDSQISHAKNNKTLQQSLIQAAKTYQTKFNITGTPSFVLTKGKEGLSTKNYELIVGNVPYENMKSQIDAFIQKTTQVVSK